MTPSLKTGLMTLPEVATGTLAEKFGEITLYNQHADIEFGSTSNSNSTSPLFIACESAPEPSCETAPLHKHFPYGLCNASRAHVEALAARWAGKEMASATTQTPTLPPATTQTLRTSSNSGRTLSSLVRGQHNRGIAVRPCYRLGHYIYSCRKIRLLARSQAYRPDRWQLTLRCLPRFTSLLGGNPLAPNEERTSTEVATTDSSLYTPDHQVFMAVGDVGPSETRPG
jgi:hypothetical protein